MSVNKQIIRAQLVNKINKVMEKSLADQQKIAVAFSGGLDSSLLAKVCQDLGKELTLLTIGFPGARDIKYAVEVADKLQLPLLVKEINREELTQGISRLAKIIKFPGVRDFEVILSLDIVFRFASVKGFKVILTATGLDALFCGFDKTRRLLEGQGREELDKLTKRIVEHAQTTEDLFDLVAKNSNIVRINPFMSDDFISFALAIPSKFKVIDQYDKVRKHILREAAMAIGVPEAAAMRPKKAIQYSTKIDRVIKKIAKQAGDDKRENYFRKIFSKT